MDLWGRLWGALTGRPGSDTVEPPRPAPSFSHEAAQLIVGSTGPLTLSEAEMITVLAEGLYRQRQIRADQLRYIAENLRLRADCPDEGAALAALLGRLRDLAIGPETPSQVGQGANCFLGYERHEEMAQD